MKLFLLVKEKKIEEEGLKEHGQGGELQQNGPLYNKLMDTQLYAEDKYGVSLTM